MDERKGVGVGAPRQVGEDAGVGDGWTSIGKIKERSGWSWGVLECEGVWDVVGVRRFGELTEQGRSSSALDAGVAGKAEEGGVWVLKDSGRGSAMTINGIGECGTGRGWCGCGCLGTMCWFLVLVLVVVVV